MHKVFFSFANQIVADTWVKSASALFFENKIEPHSYKKHPETEADLDDALLERIRQCDGFVCVLNKTYLERRVTRMELDEAILRATGRQGGNLKHQNLGLQVFVFWEDADAEKWLTTNHPGFSYQALHDYDFSYADTGPLPKNPRLWQEFFNDLNKRLDRPPNAQQARPAIETPGTGSPLLVLGRPVEPLDADTARDRTQLLEAISRENPVVVADDWAAPTQRMESAGTLNRCLGPRTVTVQVCDRAVYVANEAVPGDPMSIGRDHESQLIKLGFAPEKSRDALSRTIFWVPRRIEGVDDLPGVPQAGARQAVFSAATVPELASWLIGSVGGPSVLLKSQPGLDDIAGNLKRALQTKLGRIDFAAWAEKTFRDSIREGLDEGVPLLVAIHDRNVPVTAEWPRQMLVRQAESCDEIIENIVAGHSSPPIARAIFLLRNPDMTKDDNTVGGEPWYWVPLRRERGYVPDEQKVTQLRTQLWPAAAAARGA